MTEFNRTLSISDVVEEIEDHLSAGKQRIRAWYTKSEDPPDGYTPLEQPPHQSLIEKAGEIVVSAATGMTTIDKFGEHPVDAGLRFPMYGIGAEILLTAIHLKEDPKGFISVMNDSGPQDTPRYKDSKKVMLANLPPEVTGDQRKRIVEVLDLIRMQRNHAVHFSYHRMSHTNHFELFCDVLGFLLSVFSEEDLEAVARLDEKRTELRRRHAGMRYPEVEFEF